MTNAVLIPAAPAPESSEPTVPVRKPALPGLTGVRTLLALNIVFFHFTPPHMRYLYPVIDSAYVFTRFFFFLSGYILAYNYADRAAALVKRDFWLARFSRIYPVYLLALAVSFKMLQAEWQGRSHVEFWTGTVLTLFMLHGLSPNLATFWNTVGWTVSCEVVLYALFPWFIRLPWPRKVPQLIAVLLGLWMLGLVPHTLYYLTNPDHLAAPPDRFTSALWIRTLKYTPIAYVCTFLGGIALARIQATLTMTPRQRLALAAASLAVIVALFATVVPRIPYILMHGGLLIPVFAALTLGLSGPNHITSVFAWRPLVVLGGSTYCLYLLHFNFINLIHLYNLPEQLHLAAFDPWVSYIAAVVLGYTALHLVERPGRRFVLARFPRPRKATDSRFV